MKNLPVTFSGIDVRMAKELAETLEELIPGMKSGDEDYFIIQFDSDEEAIMIFNRDEELIGHVNF